WGFFYLSPFFLTGLLIALRRSESDIAIFAICSRASTPFRSSNVVTTSKSLIKYLQVAITAGLTPESPLIHKSPTNTLPPSGSSKRTIKTLSSPGSTSSLNFTMSPFFIVSSYVSPDIYNFTTNGCKTLQQESCTKRTPTDFVVDTCLCRIDTYF